MHHAPVVLAFLVCFGRSLEQLVWKINRRVVVFCLVMVEESWTPARSCKKRVRKGWSLRSIFLFQIVPFGAMWDDVAAYPMCFQHFICILPWKLWKCSEWPIFQMGGSTTNYTGPNVRRCSLFHGWVCQFGIFLQLVKFKNKILWCLRGRLQKIPTHEKDFSGRFRPCCCKKEKP